MGNKKTIFATAVLTAALITGGSAIVFAETAADSAETYSYTAGQKKHTERHAKFEKVPEFTTDEEREAYFTEQGIGKDKNPYDTAEGETADTSDYSYKKADSVQQTSMTERTSKNSLQTERLLRKKPTQSKRKPEESMMKFMQDLPDN